MSASSTIAITLVMSEADERRGTSGLNVGSVVAVPQR